MKRRIFMIILLAGLTLFTAIFPQKTIASNQTAETSATLTATQNAQVVKQDDRADILHAYLEQYNSPLADHVDTFIKQADTNHLDWKLVVAISGVESGFGEAIPAYSYNAWGFGIYGSNVQRFASWDDGITTVSTALRRTYMNERGATNVYQIGATYAASPTWAYRVQGNIDAIDHFAANYEAKPVLSISF